MPQDGRQQMLQRRSHLAAHWRQRHALRSVRIIAPTFSHEGAAFFGFLLCHAEGL